MSMVGVMQVASGNCHRDASKSAIPGRTDAAGRHRRPSPTGPSLVAGWH